METKSKLIEKNISLEERADKAEERAERALRERDIVRGELAENRRTLDATIVQRENYKNALEGNAQLIGDLTAQVDEANAAANDQEVRADAAECKLQSAVENLAKAIDHANGCEMDATEANEVAADLKRSLSESESLFAQACDAVECDRETIRSLSESNERLREDVQDAEKNLDWWKNLAVRNGETIARIQDAIEDVAPDEDEQVAEGFDETFTIDFDNAILHKFFSPVAAPDIQIVDERAS